MRSRPIIRHVWVKAGRPWVARGKDTPCCVGSVSGGGVDHRFDFPLQFDQPCQDVVQQHSYSPLQISCMYQRREKRENTRKCNITVLFHSYKTYNVHT